MAVSSKNTGSAFFAEVHEFRLESRVFRPPLLDIVSYIWGSSLLGMEHEVSGYGGQFCWLTWGPSED